MIFHTLNAGPGTAVFKDCLRIATSDDAILLTGDGVYAALEHTSACIELLATEIDVHALEADALAAGIVDRLSNQITISDYDDFVTLSERFPRQLAWY